MEQSRSLESNKCSASQEISGISRNSERSISHSHAPITCPEQKNPKDKKTWGIVECFITSEVVNRKKVLPPHPNPMVEDHSLSTVRTLRSRKAVVLGTHMKFGILIEPWFWCMKNYGVLLVILKQETENK